MIHLFLYLFYYLDHHESDIHVSLGLITMFSLDEFFEGHTFSVVGWVLDLLTFVASMGGFAAEFLDLFLSTYWAFYRRDVLSFVEGLVDLTSRASYHPTNVLSTSYLDVLDD